MGIKQAIKLDDNDASDIATHRAKSCMAIIWVQKGSEELDKMMLIQSVKQMAGVSGARFTREKPAILMIEYSTKETKAVDLVEGISSLGAYAKIIGC